MKKIYKILSAIVAFALIINFLLNISLSGINVSASNAQSLITMEVSTGRILSASSESIKRPMASTTKIMTAICVLENAELERVVTIKPEYVGIEGSSIYLKADEEISILDLLYGLMLQSGNDAAVALACEVGGSVEKFAKIMNETAVKLGALDTNFVNPHGLHDDEHYTTATDLAKISCYAMKNEKFKEVVSTKKIKISSPYDYPRIIVNKNKMLNEFEGATGIKTGFTKKAGRCLVSSAQKNGMEVVCVVLGCPPMFEKSKELLTAAFTDYKLVEVFNGDNFSDEIEVIGSDKKCGLQTKGALIYPLKDSEIEDIIINLDYEKCITPPFKQGDVVGKVEIYIDKQLLFCENIYTIIGVKSKDYKYILKDLIDLWPAI